MPSLATLPRLRQRIAKEPPSASLQQHPHVLEPFCPHGHSGCLFLLGDSQDGAERWTMIQPRMTTLVHFTTFPAHSGASSF